MAGPACMSNDDRPAVFVGTFLQNGDTVALCDECLPQFMTAVLAQMEGIPIDQLAGAIAGLAADAPDDPAAAAAGAAAPSHSTPVEPPADQEADDQATGVDDRSGWDMTHPPEPTGLTSNGSSAPPMDTAGQADESPPAKPARQARTVK